MITHYEIIPADPSHIEAIANNVRQADCDECWSAGLVTVRTALEISLEHATLARTWLVDGVPAAMGGITGMRDGATIWLITTELVETHRRAFVVHALAAFQKERAGFDLLYNFVDARNRRAIQWLRWMGFTLDDAKPYGPMGQPFHFFWWRRPAPEVVADDCFE